MANPLITLEAGKRHLYIPPEDIRSDAEVSEAILEASDVILVYLKAQADPLWDATTCPPRVQTAVKRMLGYLWTARDDQEAAEKAWAAIRFLLARDRDPALA